jgi:hypothetical protein
MRSVKDLGVLLELFQRRNCSLVSVAESLDTGSAAGAIAAQHHGLGEPVGARSNRCANPRRHEALFHGLQSAQRGRVDNGGALWMRAGAFLPIDCAVHSA